MKVGKKESEELDISTYPDDTVSWDIEIRLEELKATFEEILIINTYYSRYVHVSEPLRILNKKIDFLISNLKIENRTTLEKSKSYEEKKYRDSVNSKKGDVYKIIEDLTYLINNILKIPNIYIIFSEKIRNIFKIHKLFDKFNLKGSSKSLVEISCEDQILSSSNKSILENLLN
jgi:hypothetical protein